MRRLLIGALVAAAAAAAGWYLLVPHAPESSFDGDFYPLYANAEWGDPVADIFSIGTTSFAGTTLRSVPVVGTMNPGGVFTPFDLYYAGKLAGLGWRIDESLAAGGPGAGITVYTKGLDVIVVGYTTDFHVTSSTSPATCPCDVTLSLFSTR